jgi:hypothetical protein
MKRFLNAITTAFLVLILSFYLLACWALVYDAWVYEPPVKEQPRWAHAIPSPPDQVLREYRLWMLLQDEKRDEEE